jgi:transcription termination/antitermination protein NusG
MRFFIEKSANFLTPADDFVKKGIKLLTQIQQNPLDKFHAPNYCSSKEFAEGIRLMNEKSGKWYAVHTRSRFEQKVHDGVFSKSIEVFLPRIQVISRRKDRHKKILVPLLPGYVFVNSSLEPKEYLSILKTPGVVRLIGFEGKPVPARDDEINSLMILDGTDRSVQNIGYINQGDRVMIMEGPLKGLIGFYLRAKGQGKVVVSVDLLNRSLEVDIEDWALEKVS